VRVEVPNAKQELRLGMFADVTVDGAGRGAVALIPRAAVQNVGDRTVVYVADAKQAGRFIEREVRLGDRSGSDVAVLSGLRPGDQVVADGSFNVRAERDRLGLRPSGAPPSSAAEPASHQAAAGKVQDARVLVTETGYEPAKLTVRAGEVARITFVRTTDKTCGTEVVFPSLNIRRALPLNRPVVVEFTPKTSGEIGFLCGMNMLRGTVVVE